MKVKIMPPTFFWIMLLLSIGLHFVSPVRKIIYLPYTYLGIILVAFGVVLNIWSDALLKRKKTAIKPYENPTQLETSGPFRISRNPMYLGMALALLGSAIFMGSLVTFVFPIAYVIIAELFFIRFEENNLEKIFGQEYLEYKCRVRRWL